MVGVRAHHMKASPSLLGKADQAPRTVGALMIAGSRCTKTPSALNRRQATGVPSFQPTGFGVSSTRSRTTSVRSATARTSPTFSNTPTATKNPFHISTLAAIIVPVLVVLVLVSYIYRRCRRPASVQSGGEVIVVQAPQPPEQKIWNSPHQQGGSSGAPGRVDNAVNFDRPMHGGPPAPQPMPSQGGGYHAGNVGMQGNWAQHPLEGGMLGPVQAPVWTPDYGQQNPVYGHHSGNYNQQYHDFGLQNHQRGQQSHDYGYQTQSIPYTAPIPQPQQPLATPPPQPQQPVASHTLQPQHPVPSQSHTGLQPIIPVPQPPQPITGQSNTSPKPQAEASSKGEIALTWTPALAESPHAATAASPPLAQQAGPSNAGIAAQSSGNPDLHMLRERVELLEAALVVPPAAHDDTSDLPPPAYDEHPDHVVDPNRAGSRT